MAREVNLWEGRIRVLEEEVRSLRILVEQAMAEARAAKEIALRASSGGGFGDGGGEGTIYWGLVVTPIPSPASSAANATNSGTVRIRKMDTTTGAFTNDPAFADPVQVWNGWPGSTTTATTGKVVKIKRQNGKYELLIENCT